MVSEAGDDREEGRVGRNGYRVRPVRYRGESVLTRRRLVTASVATVGVAVAARPSEARRLDQDMDPYIFGITGADLKSDGVVLVSGPCEVPDPPETVDLDVKVRGDRGARARGAASVVCDHPPGGSDTFEVAATVRGAEGFTEGDTVTVCAKAHVNPPDDSAANIRWCKDVTLV